MDMFREQFKFNLMARDGRPLASKTTTKGTGTFVVVGSELDVAVRVEQHFNENLYRISSGLADLVVLGMPSLDDAKSSTLSLIPSLVKTVTV